jgi:hypothetical protein
LTTMEQISGSITSGYSCQGVIRVTQRVENNWGGTMWVTTK